MLAPNFTANEFLKHRSVTTLETVQKFQQFRDRQKKPVKLMSVKKKGKILTTTGKTRTGDSFSTKVDIRASIPIYGYNAALPDSIVREIYYGNGLSDISTVDKLLIAALCQNGYHEGPKNKTPFGEAMGLNNTPWCAIFFHWCLHRADPLYPIPFKPEFSNSRYTLENAPTVVTDPALFKSGSAVVWKRKASSVAGHTAILLHNDTEKEEMLFIEGNISDKVRVKKRSYYELTYGHLELYGAAQYLPEAASDCFKNVLLEGSVKNETYT